MDTTKQVSCLTNAYAHYCEMTMKSPNSKTLIWFDIIEWHSVRLGLVVFMGTSHKVHFVGDWCPKRTNNKSKQGQQTCEKATVVNEMHTRINQFQIYIFVHNCCRIIGVSRLMWLE